MEVATVLGTRDMSAWWKMGSARGPIALATSTADPAPDGPLRLNPILSQLSGSPLWEEPMATGHPSLGSCDTWAGEWATSIPIRLGQIGFQGAFHQWYRLYRPAGHKIPGLSKALDSERNFERITPPLYVSGHHLQGVKHSRAGLDIPITLASRDFLWLSSVSLSPLWCFQLGFFFHGF